MSQPFLSSTNSKLSPEQREALARFAALAATLGGATSCGRPTPTPEDLAELLARLGEAGKTQPDPRGR